MSYKDPARAREYSRLYRKGLIVRQRQKNCFSPYEFAHELEDLLEIPRTRVQRKTDGSTYLRPKKGTEIFYTIFQVITDALHRGENVNIPSFGSFQIKTQKAKRVINTLYGNVPGSKKSAQNHEAIAVPAKKVVIFKPAAGLDVFINSQEGLTPAWWAKQTLKYWERDADRKRKASTEAG